MSKTTRKPRQASPAKATKDLSKGVIVVLSGGPVDETNPPEVRGRMNEYITAVNDDPFVKSSTKGKGLRFHLLRGQKEKYLHQSEWRKICKALKLIDATPLIVVGHSYGGAAALNLVRCAAETKVDFLFTADSVGTLDDLGDPHAVNKVPRNVSLNINTWTIPTIENILLPFPIGRPNMRESGVPLKSLLNVGLRYRLPGAIAHRNAFYHPAGGDKRPDNSYEFPSVLLQATLASLRADPHDTILAGVVKPLQALSTGAKVEIELATAKFTKKLKP